PMMRDRMTPPSVAFDSENRLVAHDAQGLRIWPAGSTSAHTTPALTKTLPPVAATLLPMVLIARSSSARNMALVRSSAVYLWDADTPERITQVTPPPGSGVLAPAISTKSFRPGGIAGPEPAAPSFRAVQIAPDGDRIYLLEQSQGQANPLHVWNLARPSDAPTRQAHEIRWQAQHTEGAISLALRGDGNLLPV